MEDPPHRGSRFPQLVTLREAKGLVLPRLRFFAEFILSDGPRFFAEITLSTFGSLSVDSANVLRMTESEGLRMTPHLMRVY